MRSLTSAMVWYVDHMAALGEKFTGLLTTPIQWVSDWLVHAARNRPTASAEQERRPE
jgi:hypothetical protein